MTELASTTTGKPKSPWAIYAALLFGTFVTIEASTFQAPALPSITRAFGIPVSLAALVLVCYALAQAVFAPIMGRVADQHGRRKILTIGMTVFAASEFIAATAPSFTVLLLARFLQGFGVACILPGVFAYVTYLFPERQRGLTLGILTFTMTFGAASGGVLGGLLIDRFGWSSIYWVSGVLALLGLWPIRMLVPEMPVNRSQAGFDLRGAALLFAGIGALLSLPILVGNLGRSSLWVWFIAALAVLSLGLLWQHGRRISHAAVDIGILSQRAFARPAFVYWLHMIFYSAFLYALAFFINNRPGGSAAQFGFLTLFLYGSGLISAPLAGRLVDRFPPHWLTIAAMLISLVATALFLQLRVDTPLWQIIVVASIAGAAMGCNTPAAMKMALGAVPTASIGAGTGLLSMFRDLGPPAGSSLALAVFGSSMAARIQLSLEGQTAELRLDADSMASLVAAANGKGAAELGDTALRLQEAGLAVPELLQQASVAGLNWALGSVGYLLLLLVVLALLLCLGLGKPATPGGAAAMNDY